MGPPRVSARLRRKSLRPRTRAGCLKLPRPWKRERFAASRRAAARPWAPGMTRVWRAGQALRTATGTGQPFSVLINDLRRSRLAFLAARLLLAGTGTPAGVRHDALLSIRRGFNINELNTLLRQLDCVTVSVAPARWFRIAAIIRFKLAENS